MATRKVNKTKGKTRTSMFLDDAVLRASAKKAAKLGISRTMYMEQLIRRDLGLGVGVAIDAQPSVFS